MTRRYFFSSAINPHRRMRPSSWTVSLTGCWMTLSIHRNSIIVRSGRFRIERKYCVNFTAHLPPRWIRWESRHESGERRDCLHSRESSDGEALILRLSKKLYSISWVIKKSSHFFKILFARLLISMVPVSVIRTLGPKTPPKGRVPNGAPPKYPCQV